MYDLSYGYLVLKEGNLYYMLLDIHLHNVHRNVYEPHKRNIAWIEIDTYKHGDIVGFDDLDVVLDKYEWL